MTGDVKPCPDCDRTFVAVGGKHRCNPCADIRMRARWKTPAPVPDDDPLVLRLATRTSELSAATHLAVACLRTGRAAEALEVLERAM